MNPAFRCAALGAAIAGLPLAGATQTLSGPHGDRSADAARKAVPLRVELDIVAGTDGVDTRPALARGLPELAWRQAPPRVRGLRAQGRVRLRERRGGVLDLELRGALLHGMEASGQRMPGLPSAQVGAALAGEHGAWGGRVGIDHASRQRRVANGQPPATSNTLWGAALSYRSKAGPADMLWYARVENLGNRKASGPASLFAQGEAGRFALQGRTLRVGVNASF